LKLKNNRNIYVVLILLSVIISFSGCLSEAEQVPQSASDSMSDNEEFAQISSDVRTLQETFLKMDKEVHKIEEEVHKTKEDKATIKLAPQTTAPVCNANGMLYVDSSGALCYCDGSSWSAAAGNGACA
jgi:outer membrane murein-binding lipoprotein Lpp